MTRQLKHVGTSSRHSCLPVRPYPGTLLVTLSGFGK